jgi:hypothetical protein
MLGYSTLWCPKGQGLHSTPLKRSYDQLESHNLPYLDISLLARISTRWSFLQLYKIDGSYNSQVSAQEREKNTHKSSKTTRKATTRTYIERITLSHKNWHSNRFVLSHKWVGSWGVWSWYAWVLMEVKMILYIAQEAKRVVAPSSKNCTAQCRTGLVRCAPDQIRAPLLWDVWLAPFNWAGHQKVPLHMDLVSTSASHTWSCINYVVMWYNYSNSRNLRWPRTDGNWHVTDGNWLFTLVIF